jgi:high-affinity iron transporter
MGATFVITLREAFEAALLLGIVYTYLDKVGRRAQSHYVTKGALAGVAASIVLGFLVTSLSGPLLDLGPDVIGIAVLFVAVVLLTWHGWWMRQHARAIRGQVHRRLDEASETRRLWLVAVIAFTGVFREGAETVLFLWSLLSQTPVSGVGGVVGALLGIGTAAILGWAIFRGGRHVSLPAFFGVTSVLLLLVSAGLLGTAVGRLQTLGVLPGTATAWDTSWLLAEQGPLGGFLTGLLGYRATPSILEVVVYVLYVAVAVWLFFGNRSRGTSTTVGAAERRTVAMSSNEPVAPR